jgi:hypothetical protein
MKFLQGILPGGGAYRRNRGRTKNRYLLIKEETLGKYYIFTWKILAVPY